MAPNTFTLGGRSVSPEAVTSRLAAISSGAAGAQACQVPMTAAAWASGQRRWNTVAHPRLEEEAVDDQLAAPVEQVEQARLAIRALKPIVLVDADHR
jgi:hypothetical protein